MSSNEAPPVERASVQLKCDECDCEEFFDDPDTGDVTCRHCGKVAQEKTISNEAEYRVFSEDSSSKSRIHYTISKYGMSNEDVQFFTQGIRDIEEIMCKLLQGCGRNLPVENQAKAMYLEAFKLQLAQKEGRTKMSKTKELRQRYARRKQFVVSALYWALLKNGVKTWSIEDISNQLEGADVSTYSVRKCLKDLKLYNYDNN